MKKSIKIGIDIDNVLADTYSAYIDVFNKKFSTKLEYHQLTDFYYLERKTGVEFNKAREFVYQIIETEKFALNIRPYDDASNIINNWIMQGIEVIYITARPNTGYKVTNKWLKNHGLLVKNTRIFMQDSILSDMEFKKKIINHEKINLMIEDSPEIAESLSIPVLLLDRPWNRNVSKRNIIRLKNWSDVREYMKKFIKIY